MERLMQRARVLLASAHPDDWETGIAGLAVRLARTGHEVISLITTPGNIVEPEGGTPEERFPEELAACRMAGIERVLCVSAKEGELFTENVLPKKVIQVRQLEVTNALAKQFAEIIAELKPDIVLTLDPKDLHQDHRRVSELTIGPCLYKGVNPDLYTFEVTADEGRPQSHGFHPSHYVDVAKFMEVKHDLMFCHASQKPEKHWPPIKEMAGWRGQECHAEAAEGLVRLTRWGPPHPAIRPFLIESPINRSRGTGIEVDPVKFGIAHAA